MRSKYLIGLSARLARYRFVVFYGAGGVAKDLLALLEPYLDKARISVAVTKKGEKESRLSGHVVKQIDEFVAYREETLVILAVMPGLSAGMESYIKKLGFGEHMSAEEISRQMYEEIWREQIRGNKILFSNWSGGGFGGNAKYIALNLLGRRRDLDLVWVVKDEAERLPEGIRGVKYATYEHYHELGTAHIWIDNVHKNFLTRKREGQYYIQTWHGGGPLKKIEFDGENMPQSYLELCERNSQMEDIMVSPSVFNSGLYRKAFHYRGEIMECGYPRNDIFWRENGCQKRIADKYQFDGEGITVLYAPTFRDCAGREEYDLDLGAVRTSINKRFGKKCWILVRRHPSEQDRIKNQPWTEEIVDVTAYEDVQELLAAADVLITDYSSVMWDFSLSRKPVFLYHPDLSHYEKERGYYLPFWQMPYIEAFDNADLCCKIENFEEEGYRERMDAFLLKYGSLDKGKAAEAVGSRIMELLKEG